MLHWRGDDMNLDISKVMIGAENQQDFELELSLKRDFLNEIQAIESSTFNIMGTIKKVEKRLIISFNYKGNITFACDRCLTETSLDFEHVVDRELISEPSEDEPVFIEGYEVKLLPILEEDLILNLPLQILCRIDCEGICPHCGKNLNMGMCECEKEKIDPRLEALKNYSLD